MLIRARSLYHWGTYYDGNEPSALPENHVVFPLNNASQYVVYTLDDEVLINLIRCVTIRPIHDGKLSRVMLPDGQHVAISVPFADVCDALAHSITELGGDL